MSLNQREYRVDPTEYKEIEAHLQAFLLSKRNAKRAAITLAWYERHIRSWATWLTTTGRLADWLGADALDAYLEHKQSKGLEDSSVKSCFDCIRAFLRWLRKRRRIVVAMEDLPTAMVDAPEVKEKKPREADYRDLQRVIGAIYEDDWIDVRDRCILTLMLTTGLRVDEVVNIRVKDINLITGFVFVAAGKGEKSRQIPFDEQFRLAFMGWIYNRPATAEGKLFMRADRWKQPMKAAIGTAGVRGVLRRRCAAADVDYINPHSIRHLFATKALNDGIQLSAVSNMLGHESTAFTAKIYARWVQRGLREEYDSKWKVGVAPHPPAQATPLATVPQPV